jgi:hypothetical protein
MSGSTERVRNLASTPSNKPFESPRDCVNAGHGEGMQPSLDMVHSLPGEGSQERRQFFRSAVGRRPRGPVPGPALHRGSVLRAGQINQHADGPPESGRIPTGLHAGGINGVSGRDQTLGPVRPRANHDGRTARSGTARAQFTVPRFIILSLEVDRAFAQKRV